MTRRSIFATIAALFATRELPKISVVSKNKFLTNDELSAQILASWPKADRLDVIVGAGKLNLCRDAFAFVYPPLPAKSTVNFLREPLKISRS